MVLAMVGFAIEDAVIKQLSADWPISQVLFLVGITGCLPFVFYAKLKGYRLLDKKLLEPKFLIRTACELVGGIAFVSAFIFGSLSASSVILQATPLAVAIGGVVYLKQSVSTKQWLTIGIGLAGVLVIIQPGTETFAFSSLLAVISVVFLAIRDLITRSMERSVEPTVIAFWAFFAFSVAGIVTSPLFNSYASLALNHVALLALSTVAGATAYVFIVLATRGGNVATVGTFRYTRLFFALIIAVALFGEQITLPTIIGSLLIVSSGVVMLRDARKSSNK